MKRSKNMVFNETGDSRELYLYCMNDFRIYNEIQYTVKSLLKKYDKGIYDSDKAIDSFYYIATHASNYYLKEFGYAFSVMDRFTVAVNLRNDFQDEIIERLEKKGIA